MVYVDGAPLRTLAAVHCCNNFIARILGIFHVIGATKLWVAEGRLIVSFITLLYPATWYTITVSIHRYTIMSTYQADAGNRDHSGREYNLLYQANKAFATNFCWVRKHIHITMKPTKLPNPRPTLP